MEYNIELSSTDLDHLLFLIHDKIKDNLLQVLQKKEMNNNKKIRKKNCKDQIFQNKTQRFYKEAIII
jgi:hypothetical protein